MSTATIVELCEKLRSDNAKEKCDAADRLGEFGPDNTDVIEPLLEALQDFDYEDDFYSYNHIPGHPEYDWWRKYSYVSEQAFRALAKIQAAEEIIPEADIDYYIIPALKELIYRPKKESGDIISVDEPKYVIFSVEEIVVFGIAAVESVLEAYQDHPAKRYHCEDIIKALSTYLKQHQSD